MLNREVANIIFLVFGLSRLGLKTTIDNTKASTRTLTITPSMWLFQRRLIS